MVEVAEDKGALQVLAETQLWTCADAAKKGLRCVQNPRGDAVKCRRWKFASTLPGEAEFSKKDLDSAAQERSED